MSSNLVIGGILAVATAITFLAGRLIIVMVIGWGLLPIVAILLLTGYLLCLLRAAAN